MPYALLAVETNTDGNEFPDSWAAIQYSGKIPEHCKATVSNVLLLELPQALATLGKLVRELEAKKKLYSLAFFTDSPEFQKSAVSQ